MVFQPIEESGRNLFAKLCSHQESSTKGAKGSSTIKDLRQAANILGAIFHLYSLISLVALSVGPHAAPLLLRLIAGSKWSSTNAPGVLASYCYYIPMLAINGITEAFVAAVATNAELHAQGLWMGGFSIAFAAAAWLFLGAWSMGAPGLVWANCVNMALRIVWGARFIKKYFARNGVVRRNLDRRLVGKLTRIAGIQLLGRITKHNERCGRRGSRSSAKIACGSICKRRAAWAAAEDW